VTAAQCLLIWVGALFAGGLITWPTCKAHIRRSLTVREDVDGATGWRVFLGDTPVGPLRAVRGNAEKDLEQHQGAL
jgi:hypothetical protein